MSDPIVIGRLSSEELDQRPSEPIGLEMYGYTYEGHEEVKETFRFRPTVPAGAALDIMRHTSADGNIPLSQAVKYIDECILDADAQAFHDFLYRKDLMIEAGVLIEVYRGLTEAYTGRPTRRPSASASGGSTAKRTSVAAARSAASTSKRNRSS